MTVENESITIYKGESKSLDFSIKDENGNIEDLSGATLTWKLLNRNTGEVLVTKTTTDYITITNAVGGLCTVSLIPNDTNALEPANWYYHQLDMLKAGNFSTLTTGNFWIKSVKVSNLGYLIPQLRLTIGDIDPASYRYLDEWMHVALSSAVKILSSWWRDKYLIDDDGVVSRNTLYDFQGAVEPPIILYSDERPIVLVAAIAILSGSLENSAWSTYSWRDAEIAFSNLEGGRIRDANLKRLWDELLYFMKPPTHRLARSVKGSLPGYLGNDYEIGNLD